MFPCKKQNKTQNRKREAIGFLKGVSYTDAGLGLRSFWD